MGGSGSAPQAPNSAQVSADQTQSNVQTGIANATLGNTNQVTPYGSLTYNQTGGQMVGGNWVPSYTATQTLSPNQQQILTSQENLQKQALGPIGSQVLNQVQNTTQNPLSFAGAPPMPGDQTQARNDAYNALTARSTQDLDRQKQQQITQLANQGIAPGSEAYNNALLPIERAYTDASNQATINAGNVAGQNINQAQQLRNQYTGEQTQLYNQPLNTYAALTGVSGGVQNPNYAPASQGQVAPTDVSGNAYNSYNGQLQQYNTQQSQQNALMGGLFGLGGSALGTAARSSIPMLAGSDIRMKENIRHIGHTNDGQRLYSFNYIGDNRPQIGLMAQEVERTKPEAVVEIGGMKYVDYGKALENA